MQTQGLWAKGELRSSDLTSDQMSPAQGFTQQLSDAPQASRHGNHHVPQRSAAAFITLPVHPASPTRDPVHKEVLLKRSSNFAQKWLCNWPWRCLSKGSSYQQPGSCHVRKLPCHVSAGTLTNSLLLSHGSRSQDDTRPAPSHLWTPEGLQAALVFLPSDYLKLWLCNSTGTGSLFKSDARLARADLLTTLKSLLC